MKIIAVGLLALLLTGCAASTLETESYRSAAALTVEAEPTATVTESPAPAPIAAPVPEAAPAWGSYPTGWDVPFIASDNPEDAAGGYYDTTACASGSASVGADGGTYCD